MIGAISSTSTDSSTRPSGRRNCAATNRIGNVRITQRYRVDYGWNLIGRYALDSNADSPFTAADRAAA